MKRLVCIIVILFTVGCIALAETPPKLTFSDTRLVPGMSEKDIDLMAFRWYYSKRDEALFHADYLHYALNNSPVFAAYCRNKNTAVSFNFRVVCRNGSYTTQITDVEVYEPIHTLLYGENGRLFPEFYSKRQLRKCLPIVNGMSDLSAEMFAEFAKYMGVK